MSIALPYPRDIVSVSCIVSVCVCVCLFAKKKLMGPWTKSDVVNCDLYLLLDLLIGLELHLTISEL